MRVEHFASIRALDRGAWDELAADQVFASYGWLRTVEDTCTAADRPCYFVLRNSNGFDAAAACYLQAPGSRGVDFTVFGRFAKLAAVLRVNVGNALICAPRTGISRSVLTRSGATRTECQHWIAAMLDAMEAFAREHGVPVCVRNVREDGDPVLLEALRARDYLRAAEMPYTCLDVRWPTFRDYVRDLKRTHRATADNIPRELRRGERMRLTYEQLADAGPEREALHHLLDAHQRRLNGIPFPYDTRFLPLLREQIGERLVLYVARRDGKPVSIVVGLRGGDAIYLPMVGIDPAHQRETFVYFNNSYNVPIGDAITKGLRTVYSGKLLYAMKARRGYRVLPLSMYMRLPTRLRSTALRPLLAAQHLRMRRMLATVPQSS